MSITPAGVVDAKGKMTPYGRERRVLLQDEVTMFIFVKLTFLDDGAPATIVDGARITFMCDGNFEYLSISVPRNGVMTPLKMGGDSKIAIIEGPDPSMRMTPRVQLMYIVSALTGLGFKYIPGGNEKSEAFELRSDRSIN